MKLLKKLLLSAVAVTTSFQMSAVDPNFHIYLCIGQSNMEGNAMVEPIDLENVPERFMLMATQDFNAPERHVGEWYSAVPPIVGEHYGLSPADYFGRTMLAAVSENVKIGVIPVAIGGCKIEHLSKDYIPDSSASEPEWMQAKLRVYDNHPYTRLLECARKAQADGVIKGILLHQGESNNGDREWTVKVHKLYDDLLSDLGMAPNSIPLIAGETVSSEMGGVCGDMNEIIHTLPEVLPTARLASSKDLQQSGDGLHFTAVAYRELGKRYAEEMLEAQKTDHQSK